MQLGLGFLRLAPAAFWAMTPRELMFALGTGSGGEAPPSRNGLAALMRAFPDS